MKDLVFYIKGILDALKGIVDKLACNRISVTDITAIPADQLDKLECGDVVVKITGKKRHTYIVSYKGDGAGEGICLSYNAAGYGETVSYDRTESGWAYNSTDVKTYGA